MKHVSLLFRIHCACLFVYYTALGRQSLLAFIRRNFWLIRPLCLWLFWYWAIQLGIFFQLFITKLGLSLLTFFITFSLCLSTYCIFLLSVYFFNSRSFSISYIEHTFYRILENYWLDRVSVALNWYISFETPSFLKRFDNRFQWTLH